MKLNREKVYFRYISLYIKRGHKKVLTISNVDMTDKILILYNYSIKIATEPYFICKLLFGIAVSSTNILIDAAIHIVLVILLNA